MSNKNTSSTSIGFLGLLTILFIGLKLTHFINWSWWIILSPTLIPILVSLLITGVLHFLIQKRNNDPITRHNNRVKKLMRGLY